MHNHLEPEDWAFAFGHPAAGQSDGTPGTQLYSCPRCRGYRGDLDGWLEAIGRCPRCTAAFETYDRLPPETLSCRECLSAHEEFAGWREAVGHGEPFVAPEWPEAGKLLGGLTVLPLEMGLDRVRTDPTLRSWGLCQRLLEASHGLRHSDPQACQDRAALAVAIADRLDEEHYHPDWVAELRAKAYAHLGNGLRLLGYFGRAEMAFTTAESWIDAGRGQSPVEATLLSFRASLLLDQFRPDDAEALLERLERHHRDRGHLEEAAKVQLQLAQVHHAQERPRQALARVQRVLELLDRMASSKSPESLALLRAIAHHNRVAFLLDCGELERARHFFDALPSTDQASSLGLQQHWLEGDLLQAEGDLAAATDRYEQVRRAYLAQGPHYSVALVTLDLAMVAARQKRPDTVRELAREAGTLLAHTGAPEEAFAALRLLLDTVEQKAVTLTFLERISRTLARFQPRG